jgi:hypothetical protein
MIELLTLALLALVALSIFVLGYVTGRRHGAEELRRLRRRLLRTNQAHAGARRSPRPLR